MLQICQKSSGVSPVHLGVMELKGQLQFVTKPSFLVSAPDDKGVMEDSAVHPHRTIDFRIDDGRSADDHAILGQISILAGLCDFGGVFQVFGVEAGKIPVIPDVAGADLPGFVLHDGIHRKIIILDQLVPHRQYVKLFDPLRRLFRCSNPSAY